MKKVLVVLIASIFAVTSLFAGGGEYYERPLAYFNENVYEELDISSIINCYNALETDYKQKGMYETYTLISDQFKTGDFGRMFINQKEAIEKFNQSFRSFNIYFNDFPAYDFLIEYKDDSREDLKGKNLKLPEKQIAPDKNPIAPKINPSKMKAVGKRELTPIQNKKEPGLGLRTEVVNGITIRIDFLESEKYKTIRAVLEDSIKAFQAKTGAKNFSTFPKDGLALDPTTYEIYLNLVDNKGKVIEKDIGPINASKPFFYATTINTDDINKNGYKFVCNKVNFKRPNNYKESFFVNNGYKYFMANKIKIVKPGESTSYNPINEASKLYKAVKYEYPKVKPIVMDKVKAGSSYEVSPYGMSLSGETLESCINSGAKKIGTDYDYEISVMGVDKLTWYEIMNYIPKITNPTVMDMMEIEDEYNDLGNNKNKLPEYERVYGMSWFDAIYFCNELSKRDGYTPCYSVNNNTDVKKWGYIPGKGNSIKGSIKCNEKANGYRLPTSNEYDYYQDAFRGAEYHVKGWKSQVEKHNDSGDFYSGHRCYEWFNDNMDKTDLKTVKMPYPGGAEIIEAYNAEEAPTSVYKLHINEHSVMPSAMKVVRTLN